WGRTREPGARSGAPLLCGSCGPPASELALREPAINHGRVPILRVLRDVRAADVDDASAPESADLHDERRPDERRLVMDALSALEELLEDVLRSAGHELVTVAVPRVGKLVELHPLDAIDVVPRKRLLAVQAERLEVVGILSGEVVLRPEEMLPERL